MSKRGGHSRKLRACNFWLQSKILANYIQRFVHRSCRLRKILWVWFDTRSCFVVIEGWIHQTTSVIEQVIPSLWNCVFESLNILGKTLTSIIPYLPKLWPQIPHWPKKDNYSNYDPTLEITSIYAGTVVGVKSITCQNILSVQSFSSAWNSATCFFRNSSAVFKAAWLLEISSWRPLLCPGKEERKQPMRLLHGARNWQRNNCCETLNTIFQKITWFFSHPHTCLSMGDLSG